MEEERRKTPIHSMLFLDTLHRMLTRAWRDAMPNNQLYPECAIYGQPPQVQSLSDDYVSNVKKYSINTDKNDFAVIVDHGGNPFAVS